MQRCPPGLHVPKRVQNAGDWSKLSKSDKDEIKGERIWRTSTCLTRSCFKMPRKRVKWLDDEKHVRQQHALALSPSSFAEEEYAGTPPLAACRSAVSFAACLHNSGAGSNGLIGLYDTSVAFFHAVNDEGIYAEPPLGEEPEDIVYQPR